MSSQRGLTNIVSDFSYENYLVIFHNPVKNSFTINSKWPWNEINKIEFYDILGHLIFAEKN